MNNSTQENEIVRWGTSEPVGMIDAEYGELFFSASGSFSYVIKDEEKFNSFYLNAKRENGEMPVYVYLRNSVEMAFIKAFQKGNYTNFKEIKIKSLNAEFLSAIEDNGVEYIDLKIIIFKLTDESDKKVKNLMKQKMMKNLGL